MDAPDFNLASRLPIVENTRVGELQTKPFIHDVNQPGMRSKSHRRQTVLISGLEFTSGAKPDGGDRRDRTDDLKLAKLPLSQLSYVPAPKQRHHAKSAELHPAHKSMVGLGRLELPTSRLSSARSNQLSYRPKRVPFLKNWRSISDPKKEKRRRRHPALLDRDLSVHVLLRNRDEASFIRVLP